MSEAAAKKMFWQKFVGWKRKLLWLGIVAAAGVGLFVATRRVEAADPCIERRATCAAEVCSGSCSGSQPSSDCTCRCTQRCNCTDTCTTEVCANTVCTAYERECVCRWSCPSSQTRPEPTPTPQTATAACGCFALAASSNNLTSVNRGSRLEFKAEAYAAEADTAEVKNIGFAVSFGGSTVAQAQVGAHFVREQNSGGRTEGIYRALWPYAVAADAPTGSYRLDIDIACGPKASSRRRPGQRNEVVTVGTGERREGFLALVWRLLFGRQGGERQGKGEIAGIFSEFKPPFPTTVVPTGKSLQLGTFYPVTSRSEGNCDSLEFVVVE